jgi:translation initiation factor IF-2
VSLSILLSGTGNITVNDVLLASASDAVIIGFHIGKESQVPAVAKREGVEVVLHTIIYELLDRVQEAMTGLLAPRKEERVRGSALVKQKFDLGKRGCVAGCMVTKGHVRPSYRVRVRREADVLYEGSIVSLRHYQDEVAEVRESQECGIRLDNYTDFTEGDVLEFYEIEEVKQSL